MSYRPDGFFASVADRYTVGRELGRGGMAAVYLARDLKHDRDVALKLLHPELSAALGPARFLREIRIAAHLQHPHILTLIDSGEIPSSEGRPPFLYYVMPYVAGETLRGRLARSGPLPPAEALHILQDVLDALGYAHEQGIVHRDIKPENIMLSGRHALVMDFGIARAATDAAVGEALAGGTLTTMGLAVGTPNYMSPEQAVGQSAIDARADIYATGAVGYEMLAGRPPVSGDTPQAVLAAQIMQTPVPLVERSPDAPVPLTSAIMRALEKDPANRWQSAEAMLAELEVLTTPGAGLTAAGVPVSGSRSMHPVTWIAAAALVIAALVLFARSGPRAARDASASTVPQLIALKDAGALDSVWLLARALEARGDSAFAAVKPQLVRTYRIVTDPPGARVWRKAYGAPESSWLLLGTTPLDSVMAPLTSPGDEELFDSNGLRIEAPGFRTLELVGLPFTDSVIRLDPVGSIPDEMVRIPGFRVRTTYGGFGSFPALTMSSYLMDRHEVTNRDYRRFVDSGGYRRRELWDTSFVRDGRSLSWEAAVALMTDRTGRPGPATWEGGTFPAGMENHPVSGVSWYEAMAYARFAGKSLPTLPHWTHAASVTGSAWMVPASNYSARGTVPVDSTGAMSAFGIHDMAGNVREWCLNAAGSDRFIQGGSYNDPSYIFYGPANEAPFNRTPGNGIRLVKYTTTDDPGEAAGPLTRSPRRDYSRVTPVSDEVFEVYRQQFSYDRTPLNPVVREHIDEPAYTRELIRVDAAYPADSLLIYLYLPKTGSRPAPAVVYFPGGNALVEPVPQVDAVQFLEFILNSGRAVLLPVYKGTYQRRISGGPFAGRGSASYRDWVVVLGKDLRRAVDYLETRDEVTVQDLAYYGVSWGGEMGGLIPAIEPRIASSILVVAGLYSGTVRPEVDPVNYLLRIRVPTLMLAGRYDFIFPLETSQKPMFRMLGTPPEHKRHALDEGSHFVPRLLLIQETLAWLDKYQPIASAPE